MTVDVKCTSNGLETAMLCGNLMTFMHQITPFYLASLRYRSMNLTLLFHKLAILK